MYYFINKYFRHKKWSMYIYAYLYLNGLSKPPYNGTNIRHTCAQYIWKSNAKTCWNCYTYNAAIVHQRIGKNAEHVCYFQDVHRYIFSFISHSSCYKGRYICNTYVFPDIKVDKESYFPSKNIVAHSITQFAIDNLDFHEISAGTPVLCMTQNILSVS